MAATRVLITDDDDDIRELVAMNLRRAGYQTLEASHGVEAMMLIREQRPDLVILDVMMPKQDGFAVCQEMRQMSSTRNIPVLMLTAKGQTEDRINGLEYGADDYMAKPFSPQELVLRVQALLRRSSGSQERKEFKCGPFVFDLAAIKLHYQGEVLELTLLEFKLLHLLAIHEEEVVDRDTILREVWGYSESVRTRTLDTHVKRLREKLGDAAEWVQTSRGFGYVFRDPATRL